MDLPARPTSILLPGLDGTGKLFERFVAAAPASLTLRVQPLPADRPRGYEDLADELFPLLPSGPVALIAESFSGPLAVLLANRCPQVCAVVLCATFVRSPLPRPLAYLPRSLWLSPPPALALRLLMTGGDRALAAAVRSAVAQVDSSVLHARSRAALAVDASAELQRLRKPVLYLRAGRDRLIPPRCAADISATLPSVEVATLDGPHLILQAQPIESWRLISPFLNEAFSRAASKQQAAAREGRRPYQR
jgi:pimeloyl-ACP methyl ester carboxylesterase